jgi:hypothetical protein
VAAEVEEVVEVVEAEEEAAAAPLVAVAAEAAEAALVGAALEEEAELRPSSRVRSIPRPAVAAREVASYGPDGWRSPRSA